MRGQDILEVVYLVVDEAEADWEGRWLRRVDSASHSQQQQRELLLGTETVLLGGCSTAFSI